MVRKHPILVVDDEPSVCFLLKEELSAVKTYAVSTAQDGVEALNMLKTQPFEAVLLDVNMPRMNGIEVLKYIREHHPTIQVLMLSNVADLKTAIQATKLGAYDFISKPYNHEELTATVHRAIEHRKLTVDNELMKYELTRQKGKQEIIGESAAMKQVIATARKVASTDSIVHIYGPSGSGKELIANLIHQESARAEGPYVVVNCASIPDTLLESELFGHEKGAFTNAIQMKQGLVEVANGGTLFLDEVGDISSMIQPKLLRFLETGEFRRVGGTASMKVDVRIISATNKNLTTEVKEGRFREDLLYRLNVVTISIPPLNERKEDIPLLVKYFLGSQHRVKGNKTISSDALHVLMQYDWPGNIRELHHAIEGALILSQNDEITPQDFLLASSKVGSSTHTMSSSSSMKLTEMEKVHIQHVLSRNNFNRIKTARELGITPKTLYSKIKKYKIKVPTE